MYVIEQRTERLGEGEGDRGRSVCGPHAELWEGTLSFSDGSQSGGEEDIIGGKMI